MTNKYRMILLCEDGTLISDEGIFLGTIKDNSLWENPKVSPKLMKLSKKHGMYYPRCFLHKASRSTIDEPFELDELQVTQELTPYYSLSEDKLKVEFLGPLGEIPSGLNEALTPKQDNS